MSLGSLNVGDSVSSMLQSPLKGKALTHAAESSLAPMKNQLRSDAAEGASDSIEMSLKNGFCRLAFR